MSISPHLDQRTELPLFDGAVQQLPRPLPLLLQLIEQEGREKRVNLSHALAGLNRYQNAKRTCTPSCERNIYAQKGAVTLWKSGQWLEGRELVLLVPSIINSPDIMDLSDGISLCEFLAQNYNVLLADWGKVNARRANEDFEALIIDYLVPLTKNAAQQEQSAPHIVGYCLGGLFALALTHFVTAKSLSLIATPWDFAAYSGDQRAALAQLWHSQSEICKELGLMPFELMQSGFWMLEPDRVAAKYAKAFHMDDARFAGFTRVEDWANGGEPLMLGAARDLHERFFQSNMAVRGNWRVDNKRIAEIPQGLPCLSVRSTNDRIVPQNVSAAFGKVIDVSSGHIGMMVGSRRVTHLWTPLSEFLSANR